MRAFKQGELDFLVIDLPPGTGDVALTLCQNAPLTGAVIVTTPQDIALLDARKGLKMFEKVEVPVLGIVENMSIHICSNCGHEESIFGTGGGQAMSDQYGVDLLGQLPLDITSLALEDSSHGQYTLDTTNSGLPGELQPGQETTVTVGFSPRWGGPHSDALVVQSSDVNEPEVLVKLAGHASPLMKRAGGGSMLAMTYLASQRVVPKYNVMGAAKAALEHGVRRLAGELGPRNIRVNAISAGAVKTLAAAGIGGFRKMLAYAEKAAPLRRTVTIEEVGNAAAFLCSDLASGITGETTFVDAGVNIMGMVFDED